MEWNAPGILQFNRAAYTVLGPESPPWWRTWRMCRWEAEAPVRPRNRCRSSGRVAASICVVPKRLGPETGSRRPPDGSSRTASRGRPAHHGRCSGERGRNDWGEGGIRIRSRREVIVDRDVGDPEVPARLKERNPHWPSL